MTIMEQQRESCRGVHLAEHHLFSRRLLFVFVVLTVVAIFVTGWASLAAVAKIERQSGGTDWRKR
jgi:hypothetical protein